MEGQAPLPALPCFLSYKIRFQDFKEFFLTNPIARNTDPSRKVTVVSGSGVKVVVEGVNVADHDALIEPPLEIIFNIDWILAP